MIAILPLSIENNQNIKFLKWQGGDRSDYMCGLFSKNIYLKKNDFFYLWKLIKKDISSFDIVYFEKQPQFIENITNPFVYELDEEDDKEFVSIRPSKCVAKHIRLKTFKFTKTNMSKHSTNKQFRKKHNIKQPRGSMRHGSRK